MVWKLKIQGESIKRRDSIKPVSSFISCVNISVFANLHVYLLPFNPLRSLMLRDSTQEAAWACLKADSSQNVPLKPRVYGSSEIDPVQLPYEARKDKVQPKRISKASKNGNTKAGLHTQKMMLSLAGRKLLGRGSL